jgi:hypothetical protein
MATGGWHEEYDRGRNAEALPSYVPKGAIVGYAEPLRAKT